MVKMRVGTASGVGYHLPAGMHVPCSRSLVSAAPVRALSAEHSASTSRVEPASYERVLRYPDGNERRIRYPVASQASARPAEDAQTWDTLRSYSEEWDPERWGEEWSAAGVWESTRARPNSRWARRQAAAGLRSDTSLPDAQQHIPDSPEALVRQVTSISYREAQRRMLQEVRASYEVLTSSPWVQSRTVHVMAVQHPNAEQAATYTLRTRLQRHDTSEALGKLIKRRNKDGSSVLRVDEIRDGVVTFEDAEDCERFFNQLPHNAGVHYLMATCDSHQLFRMAQDLRAAIVLLRSGCNVPSPQQLSSSLLGSKPLEDHRDGSTSDD